MHFSQSICYQTQAAGGGQPVLLVALFDRLLNTIAIAKTTTNRDYRTLIHTTPRNSSEVTFYIFGLFIVMGLFSFYIVENAQRQKYCRSGWHHQVSKIRLAGHWGNAVKIYLSFHGVVGLCIHSYSTFSVQSPR